MNEFIDVIIKLSDLILSFLLIVIIVYMVFEKLLTKSSFNSKMRLMGIFLDLKVNQIIALSAITIKYIYIIYTIISLEKVDYIYLLFTLILTSIYLVMIKNIKSSVIEIVNCFAVYYLFKILMLVYSYMKEVRYEWYLVVVVALGIVFMMLYNTYFILKNINSIITQNKFIKKEEKANVVKKI